MKARRMRTVADTRQNKGFISVHVISTLSRLIFAGIPLCLMCVFQTQEKFSWKETSIQPQATWLVNPFGAAHLSLTDSEISRSQIYWQLSETGNLQPKSYWACPPAGTEILAQHLQNLIFSQPGLRVHIYNFIILCSLSHVQNLSPYHLCDCITYCFTRKGWDRQAGKLTQHCTKGKLLFVKQMLPIQLTL